MTALKQRFSRDLVVSGAAVGVFVASFRVLRLVNVSSSFAAALASLGGCVCDPSMASPLFTLWLAAKGVRQFFPPASSSLLPVSVLMLSSTYAIPTGYKHPHEVHPSYQRFLEAWVLAIGVSLRHWRDPPAGAGKILSDGVHPGTSILSFMLRRAIPGCLWMGAKFNAPIYALQLLLQWGRVNLWRHLANFVRSSVFLGNYVASCWAAVLLYSKYVSKGTITRNQAMSFAWIFGAWGFVERRSRQVELASYISAHAGYAVYTRLCNARVLEAGSPSHRVFFAVVLAVLGVAPLFAESKDSESRPNALWSAVFGK